MRNDMYKVIVERPRRGGHGASGARRLADIDESPKREGLRKRHRDRKWLNENLRPLERYLASQVGRPWNKVYAEICAHIDRRNTVQQHIHQHLSDFVAVVVVDVDGVSCTEGWRGPEPLERYWAARFYVDATTGLLRINRLREKARREYRQDRAREMQTVPEHRRSIDATHQLHRIEGIWYAVELARVAEAEQVQAKPFDVLRLCEPALCPPSNDKNDVASNRTLFGRDDMYAWRKRQLNACELRAHDISNSNA